MADDPSQRSGTTSVSRIVPFGTPWSGAAIWVAAVTAVFAQGFDGLAIAVGISGALFLTALFQARRTGHPNASNANSPRFTPELGTTSRLALALALAALIAAELQIAATGIDVLFAHNTPITPMLAVSVSTSANVSAGLIAATLAAVIAAVALALAPPRTTRAITISVVAAIVIVVAGCLAAVVWRDGITALVSLPAVTEITSIEARLLEKRLADPATLRAHTVPFLKTDAVNFVALAVLIAVGLAALTAAFAGPGFTGPITTRSSAIVALLLVAALPAIASSGKRDLMATVDSGITVNAPPAWLTSQVAAGTVELCGKPIPRTGKVTDACGKGFGRDGRIRWQDISFERAGAPYAAISASTPSTGIAVALTGLVLAIATFGAALVGGALVSLGAGAMTSATLPGASGAAPSNADTSAAPTMTRALAVILIGSAIAASGLAGVGALVALAAGIAAVAMLPPMLVTIVKPRAAQSASAMLTVSASVMLGVVLVVVLALAPKLVPYTAFEWSGAAKSAPPALTRRLTTLATQTAAATSPAQRTAAEAQARRIIEDRITWLGLKPAASGLIGLMAALLIGVFGVLLNARR